VRGPGHHVTTWTVVNDIQSSDAQSFKEICKDFGQIDFDIVPNMRDKRGKYPRTNFHHLFRYLFPGVDSECLDNLPDQPSLDDSYSSFLNMYTFWQLLVTYPDPH